MGCETAKRWVDTSQKVSRRRFQRTFECGIREGYGPRALLHNNQLQFAQRIPYEGYRSILIVSRPRGSGVPGHPRGLGRVLRFATVGHAVHEITSCARQTRNDLVIKTS